MDGIKDKLKKNTAILDPYAAKVPVFVDLSAKVDLNPGSLLAFVGSIILLIFLVLQGWTIIVTTACVLYPALHSIRAIESEDEEDDKVWLTYWMIFGIFNVLETFVGFILWYIPYWGYIRVFGFIWLLLPNFNGAKTLYETVFRPLLLKNKDLIEKYSSKLTADIGNVQKMASDASKAAVSDAMKDPNMILAAAQGMQ